MKWWVVLIVVWAVVNAVYLTYCFLKHRMRTKLNLRYNPETDEWERQ